MEKTIHHGRNIKRFREMFGMKQEAMAAELGDDWNQKKISLLEAKEAIDDDILEEVAKVLKVPSEAIKNFDEETAIHNIQNNYDSAVVNAGPTINYKCNIDPAEKWLEALEENKRLSEENKKLYERLLESEKEKNALLQKMLDSK